MWSIMNAPTVLLATTLFLIPLLASAKNPDPAAVFDKARQTAITPQEALQRLKDGNSRFVSGLGIQRDLLAQASATEAGQFPFAVVVSCLDSRTSAELVFDQGLGDIFNARVAGNVVNDDILGSLEFACKAAGAKLIAVVGHSACGAVMGAVDGVELGNLTGLLQRIEPAVAEAKGEVKGEATSKNTALVEQATADNVALQLKNIREKSPILREMLDKGQIMLVGAVHDLGTGQVTFLEVDSD